MTTWVPINLSFVKLLVYSQLLLCMIVELLERENLTLQSCQVFKVLHPQENFYFRIVTKAVEVKGWGNGSVGKVLAMHHVLS